MSSSARTAMCIRVLSSSLAEVGERLSGVDMVADVGRRFRRHVKVKNKWIACEIAQSTMTNKSTIIWQMDPHVLAQVVTSAERLITSLVWAGVRFLTIEYDNSERKRKTYVCRVCEYSEHVASNALHARNTCHNPEPRRQTFSSTALLL